MTLVLYLECSSFLTSFPRNVLFSINGSRRAGQIVFQPIQVPGTYSSKDTRRRSKAIGVYTSFHPMDRSERYEP